MSAGKRSAGLLLFRTTGTDTPTGTGRERDVEVLIGHMGGPFWAGREAA
ncbi:DNA mismatch repair protein MutT, partial [Streptomyces sp. SID8455]|nr:DNA mismatch repair protein MutT [Streptomyces sp. SID8455]